MPRVKFDYVVSFSSEDPEHRAANLLAGEVSKKKWLCIKGEPSCSVVLQLPRAIEISAVHIGAYHAALVEVLVGLSERPNDPFQVLVPSCVFVPPAQSRRDEGVDRVRSFSGDELAADTRGKRYDRVRVVCSQPYNKHCQYGLSFVHIHEPENRTDPPPEPPAALPSRLFGVGTYSSDEEEFRPGELFAKHLKSPSTDNSGNTSTGAQIRQATSHALKNISDSSTKLLKTPINKAGTSRKKENEEVPTNRQRDNLMYTDDDDKPHAKIDRIVNRHKDEKTKDDELNKTRNIDKDKNKDKSNRRSDSTKNKERNSGSRENSQSNNDKKFNKTSNDSPESTNRKRQREMLQQQKKTPEPQSNKKRKRIDDDDDTGGSEQIGAICEDQSQILRGVTLVLSGYEGARRARARDTALALGARYSPDWNSRCTHLICAFPNTPKLRTARASGAHVGVATADWLDECLKARRRLPWQWYATIPSERTPVRPLPKVEEPKHAQVQQEVSSDANTDDEIESAMEEIATRKRVSSPSDVCFVKDERFKGHVTLLDSDEDEEDTDIEDYTAIEEQIDTDKALPDFFDGYTFVISDEVVNKSERELLARYVRAFGGLLIEESEIDEDTKVDYVIGAKSNDDKALGGGTRVRPSWVWDCGRERRLCALTS